MAINYNLLKELISIDSPTGYTANAEKYILKYLKSKGLKTSTTNKGVVKCSFSSKPKLALAAHLDTLGAIVSNINSNGTLRISMLGGYPLTSFEGSYLKVISLKGKEFNGTLLLDDPSAHANKSIDRTDRNLKNVHVRLDEVVSSAADVKKLGIQNGDIVCFDTNYQHLKSGYIKSRFMDNKAGCLVLMELAAQLSKSKKEVPVELFFSNYEEVSHGGTCGYSDSIEELLVIDMGVVGDAVSGDELSCSICAKDSHGPYDYEMRKKLTEIAQRKKIPHKVDVYPHYGSDGSAALKAGNDFRVALIGPGVAASHGVERTHEKGIKATVELCLAYIREEL
ncbi:MAG: M42 family metallopeptidase [Bacteroidia bacterium]|nr:M42 family metallopeptidase [Bacteroidia bacterium]